MSLEQVIKALKETAEGSGMEQMKVLVVSYTTGATMYEGTIKDLVNKYSNNKAMSVFLSGNLDKWIVVSYRHSPLTEADINKPVYNQPIKITVF